MNNDKVQCVILAAGQGTRMKSERPKVLHPIAGKPMVQYAIEAAYSIGSRRPIVVIGHGAEQVQHALGDHVDTVRQIPQQGTGHALLQARSKLDPAAELVLVLYGDTPFLSAATIQRLLDTHLAAGAVLSLVTFTPDDPALYGRIIRDAGGRLLDIVEYKEATPEQRALREVNSGIFCYQTQWLLAHLEQLQPRAGHGEYYLTDLVNLAAQEQAKTATCSCDEAEVLGINDRAQLAAAERWMREKINLRLMLSGVTLIDPATTYVEAQVTIEPDTVIYPGTHIQGATIIGRECTLGPNTIIEDSRIGNRVEIVASLVEGATIEDDVDIGPFSHLRPGTHLDEGVHIGNFAEVKDSRLGPGTKQGHFSYLGNATIGANVNIGAGTITCNYDGQRKHPTTIGANTFIGSDTLLVAPVNIGHDAGTGAGAVVTHDVADHELVYGVPARPKVKKNREA
ncbi:bifunctional UDP-N-acetylglucosamine pyrophosphorylase / Glucosamine-1-phosphate N-acetyltransferase [Thermoflexales bacterium]|nr:bifunctional UDP-N-acetylglucosamine pyrophosphorylase / Glucosamine-1-phosphate N-acetyltransferase [Thermoflexales bacterium]